jgi:hypothetical protein
MKNFRWTIAFAFIALGLVALVIWDNRRTEAIANKKEKEEQVLQIHQEDATSISISNAALGLNIDLEKIGEFWSVKSPFADLADSPEVMQLLKSVTDEKSREIVVEGDNIDLKIYGLDHPAASIKVANKDGKNQEVKIGSAKAFDSNLYAQVDDQKKVLLVASSWTGHLNKPLREYRNKHLYRVKENGPKAQDAPGNIKNVEALELSYTDQGKKTEFGFVKAANGDWEMRGGKDLLTLNQESIIHFIEQAKGIRAVDFVERDKSAAGVLAKYGLDRPNLTLRLRVSDHSPFEIKISTEKRGEPRVFALSSDLTDVTALLTGVANGLRKSPEDFFDKKLPFQFLTNDIKKISIHSAEVNGNFIREGKSWASEDVGLQERVDSAKLAELLTGLGHLEAQGYMPKDGASTRSMNLNKSAAGASGGVGGFRSAATPDNSIVLMDGDGKKAFELVWSEKVTPKKGADAPEILYLIARTNKVDRDLKLSSAAIESLHLKDILKASMDKSAAGDRTSDGKAKK